MNKVWVVGEFDPDCNSRHIFIRFSNGDFCFREERFLAEFARVP